MVCVNSVCVTPRNLTLKVGDWYYGATADICPCDATNRCVAWHSDNTSVATVNASIGYIYAKAVGTARVYATAADGSGCSGYMTVTVSDTIEIDSITLNRSSVSIEQGNCYSLSAMVCPENATNKELSWSSSNTSVATVSNGVVCAVANGVANITVSATDGSGKSATCRVTVTGDTLVSSITVSPSNKTMTKGSSAFLYASVCPTNATNKCVTWSSSNTNVATVNPTSGLVLAKNVGTAYIYATAQDGSGKMGYCQLTVPTTVSVTGVSVSPKLRTLGVGETAYLHATVFPCNATNKTVTWSSDSPYIATVGTHTGLVTAISAGTTVITATTVDGSLDDSCTVTVDLRDKVTVQKQGNFFNMTFPSGRVWKSVGCDLENPNNRTSGTSLNRAYYDYLNNAEKRFVDNYDYRMVYTVQELAFIYRFDPYGIVYLMKYGATDRFNSLSDKLTFKDNVYNAIFGTPVTGRFYFRVVNREMQYSTWSGYSRTEVFSNAEILFGYHPIFDWESLLEQSWKFQEQNKGGSNPMTIAMFSVRVAAEIAKDVVSPRIDDAIDTVTEKNSVLRKLRNIHNNRNKLINCNLPESYYTEQKIKKEGALSSLYHQKNQKEGENRKYVGNGLFTFFGMEFISPETVYYGDGTINDTPEDEGSVNFVSSKGSNVLTFGWRMSGHFVFDMLPYFVWGNSPEDSTTIIERIGMGWLY